VSVLFLSYTALTEPLGQSQVLPYARGLARRGFRMRVVSFEKDRGQDTFEPIERSLQADGIAWARLAYHSRPRVAATAYDVARGTLHCLRDRDRVRLVHARAHVPALMADMAGCISRTPYLFDHRGLMADEFADSGLWPRGGWLYRMVNRLEARFLRRAAGVVVLTERYRDELGPDPRIEVIPCAVDLAVFRPPRVLERPYELVYAGSWSGLYLADQMLRFFAALRRVRPEARLLVLTPRGRPPPAVGDGIEAIHATPGQVPALLGRARAGLSLRCPGRAQVAAAPVKVSEYLASGLPVVSTAGVGDLDGLLPSTGTGVLLNGLSDDEMDRAAAELIRLLRDESTVVDRCRRLAEERYGLEAAIDRYAATYRRIQDSRQPAAAAR
jgi:glycosyltransferase involved in cell wall biosynthesis